jgi:hypothetical protein
MEVTEINAINFLHMVEGKLGFNPTDIKINQAKVTAGAQLGAPPGWQQDAA